MKEQFVYTAGHKLRRLEIGELEKSPDAGPVWVLNSSRGDRRGDVVLTVARSVGIGSDTVVVPSTWIPLDLTMAVARSQLLKDNQFRQALMHDLLTLVSPEDAQKVFAEDEAAVDERKRLSNYMLVGAVAFQQQQAVNNDVEVFGGGKADDDEIPAPVKHLIQQIEVAHREGELTEEAENGFVARLRSMGNMEVEVYKHVYHKTAKLAPKVSKMAKRLGQQGQEE